MNLSERNWFFQKNRYFFLRLRHVSKLLHYIFLRGKNHQTDILHLQNLNFIHLYRIKATYIKCSKIKDILRISGRLGRFYILQTFVLNINLQIPFKKERIQRKSINYLKLKQKMERSFSKTFAIMTSQSIISYPRKMSNE